MKRKTNHITKSSQEDSQVNRKRVKKPAPDSSGTGSTPSWETTRFFHQPKHPKSVLPTIQQNGTVSRGPTAQHPRLRPNMTLKAPLRPTTGGGRPNVASAYSKSALNQSNAQGNNDDNDDNLRKNKKQHLMRKGDNNKNINKSSSSLLQLSKSVSRRGQDNTGTADTANESEQQAKTKTKTKPKERTSALSPATIEKVRTQIASLASMIVSDPNKNYGKLSELRQISVQYKGKLSSLSLLTEAQVYRDIIPGYRIRMISEKEQETKVSKQVLELRSFEQSLLTNYRKFTKSCVHQSQFRTAGNVETQAAKDMIQVKITAGKCLCMLLEANPHFNDSDTVLTAAVIQMTSDKLSNIRAIACQCISTLFQSVHRLSGASLITCMELAKGLAKHADSSRRARLVSEESILPLSEINFHAFARLPIGKQDDDKNDRQGKRMSKRKREMEMKKKNRAEYKAQEKNKEINFNTDELEKDMKESQAEATPQELYHARKSLLSSVCTACFNVIKEASADILIQETSEKNAVSNSQNQSKNRKPPPALSAALKGLLCICRFISSAVIDAIIAALIPMLKYSNSKDGGVVRQYPLSLRFRCATVAYEICKIRSKEDMNNNRNKDKDKKNGGLDDNEGSFETDTHELDSALYMMLGTLYDEYETRLVDEESIMFDVIETMYACMNGGRNLPAIRSASFARRLSMLSLGSSTSHTCAIGYLKSCQYFLHPALLPISATGSDRVINDNDDAIDDDWQGEHEAYDIKCDNIDLTNASKSMAWELFSHQCHFHPTVKQIANDCLHGTCGDRIVKNIHNSIAFTKNFISSEGGFNPLPQETYNSNNKQLSKKTVSDRYHVSKDVAVRMLHANEGDGDWNKLLSFGNDGMDKLNLKGKDDDKSHNGINNGHGRAFFGGHYFQRLFEQNSISAENDS